MRIIEKNKWLVCLSQVGAWVLLILLFLIRPLQRLLFPVVNNTPAAFTVSIWLTQSLVMMNIIVYLINLRWFRDNPDENTKIQIKRIAKLHLSVSAIHILFVFASIILIAGNEDL